MWYRIFGTSEAAVDPNAVLEHLHAAGFEITGHFRGDDLGWFHADLLFGGEAAIEVERYLASEEGIRAQLNTWAAWLESQSDNPQQAPLMQHMVSTKQLFTLSPPLDDELPRQICLALCRFLARATEGVYQIDGQGFFAADASLLVAEHEG